jgi:hypothetical protein
MSPEQAAGFADVDARTDVYSLAILVYEMIVGEIPGRWVTEDSTRAGRFLDCPASQRTTLSNAGSVVEGALVRALALRPDQRTATPARFIEELRGLALAVRRKYRPDEIEAIVNRAAELEATNPTESGSMTMGGVEEIAREVGIDPRAVRSAASQLSPLSNSRDTGLEQPKSNILIGGPTRLLYHRVVDGELADGDYPILVDEIRTLIGEVGQVSQLGHSFSWVLNKGQSGMRSIEVAVTVRSGKTRITVQENLGSLIGAIFGGIGGGVGGGGLGPIVALTAGALHAPPLLAFMIPAWLITAYGIARTSFYYAVGRRQKVLNYLADRLADLSRELIGEKRLLPPPR